MPQLGVGSIVPYLVEAASYTCPKATHGLSQGYVNPDVPFQRPQTIPANARLTTNVLLWGVNGPWENAHLLPKSVNEQLVSPDTPLSDLVGSIQCRYTEGTPQLVSLLSAVSELIPCLSSIQPEYSASKTDLPRRAFPTLLHRNTHIILIRICTFLPLTHGKHSLSSICQAAKVTPIEFAAKAFPETTAAT